MDPIIIVLLAVFIGIPVLSIIVMGVFAATSKFSFVEIRVRGGSMRGAIASALARVFVKDTATVQLPLEVVLARDGIMGSSTPLFGGMSVQDIEAWIYMDDEHVSTVTEAHTTLIKSSEDRLVLPINVDVHLPQGVIRAYRDYRSKKRRAAEVKLSVRGHVIVRHWFINRRIPVRLTRHVVLGDAVPRLTSVRWRAAAAQADVWERAQVSVRLDNAYRDETLEGTVRIELRRRRRMLPDVLLVTNEEANVQIKPNHHQIFLFETSFAPAQGPLLEGGSVPSAQSAPDGGARGGMGGERDGAPGAPAKWSPVARASDGSALGDVQAVGGREVPDAAPHIVLVSLRVFFNDQELTPEEVRVLGVPGAKHGPWLSTGLDGGSRREAQARARLEPVEAAGKKRHG